MDFKHLDNIQLITLHSDLMILHSTGREARLFLGDATRTISAGSAIIIADPRMNDLIWDLVVESYKELQTRFSNVIQADNTANQTTSET